MYHTLDYVVASITLGIGLCIPVAGQEANDSKSDQIAADAMKALDRMGAYLRTLKDFQVQAEITSEDVLDDGEKRQYGSTADILVHTPHQLRAEVEGEQKSRLMLYDGKSFTFYARRVGYYATIAAPSTIRQLVDLLADKYDIEVPLVDLFLWGDSDAKAHEITSADDVGPGMVGGVTCEHYAFRQPGLDWQIWIQLGDHPLPRKYVLTTTADEARPQHTTVLTWNLAPSYNPPAFVFDPPPDAHKIVLAETDNGKETQK